MSDSANRMDAAWAGRRRVPSPDAGKDGRPSRLLNGLLAALSLAVALGVAELSLRLLPEYQVQTGTGEYLFCSDASTRHQAHPEFGYTEVPGNSYFERFSALDPWNYVSINEEGFRDNRPRTGRQVFVMGDSMVRGSIVDERDGFTRLLDAWHPGTTFRNYGLGGYGQANALKIYEATGPAVPHDLVIQGVSLSTDIRDNYALGDLHGDGIRLKVRPKSVEDQKSAPFLLRIHLMLWQNTQLYPFLYASLVRPFLPDLKPADVDASIEVTRRMLVRLAADARANHAELLLLVLPGWAEVAGLDDGLAPQRQRAMLEALAASTPGVSLIDPTPALLAAGPQRTYGVLDKHLNARGHFIVASALDGWLAVHRPDAGKAAPLQRSFAPTPSLSADCMEAGRYRAALSKP